MRQNLAENDYLDEEFSAAKTESADYYRNQHIAIVEGSKQLEASKEEAQLIDADQCKKLFGLGAYFGRKKYLESIKEIDLELASYAAAYQSNIAEARKWMEQIREVADMRQYLLTHSEIDVQEVEALPYQEVLSRIGIYNARIAIQKAEASKIHQFIRAGYITLEEASGENVDEYLSRAQAESEHDDEKKYDRGEELKSVNLCFSRRSEFAPEVENGVAFVRTPFTAVDDPMNPHFARVSSHWALNHVASDPGLYGTYGTKVTVVCEGDRFIEQNGLPKRIDYADVYWLHDLELPHGTKVYIQAETFDDAIAEQLKEAGLEVHILNENPDGDYFQNEITNWGYSGAEICAGLKQYADELGIEFGAHEGEEADIATHMVNDVIEAIKEARLKPSEETCQDAFHKYEDCIKRVTQTMPKNRAYKEQIEKIQHLLGPLIEDLKKVLTRAPE